MNCMFCAAPGPLTREHLLSRPVATAYGIDRASTFGRADRIVTDVTLADLDDLSVRMTCATCNNTWMNDLEHRMADVAEWVAGGSARLGEQREWTVRSWLFKTYLVLCVLEGGIRNFGRGDEIEFHVVPDPGRMSRIRERADDAFQGLTFGVGRVADRGRFAYSFGNPTVRPVGERYAGAISASAAALTLGAVQLWIIAPLFRGASVQLPPRVAPLTSRTRFSQVRQVALVGDLEDSIVTNPEHDVRLLSEQLAAWAAQQ